jgi:ankyrin repeat protein
LMMAIINKNKPIFDLLLAYDANLLPQDAKNNTALHYALFSQD